MKMPKALVGVTFWPILLTNPVFAEAIVAWKCAGNDAAVALSASTKDAAMVVVACTCRSGIVDAQV